MKWIIWLPGLVVSASAQPPTIPIGADAYRQWERRPYQRIGVRAYMRSTYDRSGGNENADASHFLYQEAMISMSRWTCNRPAAFTSFATTTGTADPQHPAQGSGFLPERSFPKPLAWKRLPKRNPHLRTPGHEPPGQSTWAWPLFTIVRSVL